MNKDTRKNAGAKKPASTAKSTASKPAARKNASARTAKRPAAIQKKASPKPAAKPAPKPAAKPAAKRAARPAKRATTIAARADIGFGNQIFIRGEGPGLSWDRGVPMECKEADRWQWSVEGADRPFAFKLLINDQLWSHGENDLARPAETNVVQPRF